MKNISRRGRVGNDHVVFGAELQEPFGAATGVLGALTFVTVWQKHHQAIHSLPFGFGARHELINNDLGAIYKVTKLRLPKNKSAWRRHGITVFKTKNTKFRQQGIIDMKFLLTLLDVIKTAIRVVGIGIKEIGMAVRESTALHILARHPHQTALGQQRAVCEQLGLSPTQDLGIKKRCPAIDQ